MSAATDRDEECILYVDEARIKVYFKQEIDFILFGSALSIALAFATN